MGAVRNDSNLCQENIFEIIWYIKFSIYSTKFNRDFFAKTHLSEVSNKNKYTI